MTKSMALRDTGDYIAGIATSSAQTSVNITLLDVIDNTVNSLSGLTNILTTFNTLIHDALKGIEEKVIIESQYVDPDDNAINSIVLASLQLKTVLNDLVHRRASIDADERLNHDHCESLHQEFDLAISAINTLIDSLADIRFLIIKHDLAAEPRDCAEYESVNTLIADLRK
ncbi:MAG TPA: hypothetical protein VIO56_03055 [Methylotenera sp.]